MKVFVTDYKKARTGQRPEEALEVKEMHFFRHYSGREEVSLELEDGTCTTFEFETQYVLGKD